MCGKIENDSGEIICALVSDSLSLRYLFFFRFLSLWTGRTAGGAYAGASAGYGVGASAAIGGGLDDNGGHGGSGAEAHAGGISKKVVKLTQTEGGPGQTVSSIQR